MKFSVLCISAAAAATPALAHDPHPNPNGKLYAAVAYYDCSTHDSKCFVPSPWRGSHIDSFIGRFDPKDSGAIGFKATGGRVFVGWVTVDIGAVHGINPWGDLSMVLNDGERLILTAMPGMTFDTSEFGNGLDPCPTPIINVWVNGKRHQFFDHEKVLVAQCKTLAQQPNEGHNWVHVSETP